MQEKVALRKVFSDTLLEYAQKNKNIIVVTTDARGSASVDNFSKNLPNQFIEIGIAEQNAVGVAAGLSLKGKIPFVCGPACFLTTRSLEQIKVDVAYTNTNVKIIGVSGGISYGPLGATHHCLHDIAAIRTFPNMTIIFPSDAHIARLMVNELIEKKGPVYVRMGRNPVSTIYNSENAKFEIGKANILLDGDDITLISTGEMLEYAMDCAKILENARIFCRVIDMHTIKPIDKDIILKSAKETKMIVTLEEHSIFGGLGSIVSEILSQNHHIPIDIVAFPDENIICGSPKEIFEHYQMTGEKIAERIIRKFKK